jgi:phosphoglycerate dehydrogenase-like enzyme
MPRIAVTELEYDKARGVFETAANQGLECLRAPDPDADLAAFIQAKGAGHAIVGVSAYPSAVYCAIPRGGVLARFGIGHDGIDKETATRAGILCTNTPGALDDSVAEHALGLITAAARHLPPLAADVRGGAWKPRVGRELQGKRLAIVGCGNIGRRVAQIAHFGFRMEVAGCEVMDVDAEALRRECGVSRVTADFADAVAGADFVSLHIPAIPATKHFINADRLAAMEPQAWLVNTARGSVVDESALYDALAGGRLGGAALDVFETEPYAPVDPAKDLRALDNVVMAPHIGSSTQEACDRMARRALANIAHAEAGEVAEMDLLNPAVLGRREVQDL